MRRILTLVLAVGLGLVAVSLVAPDAAPFPEFGTTVPPEPDGAVGDSSVWYCSLVDSGAVHDSSFELATAVDVDGLITLPSPIPNEDPDSLDFAVEGPGALSVDVAEIIRRGEAPGIVEFDDGPAATTAVVWADAVLTGDRCVVSVPKLWHLPGGTTADGFFLNLRLFNPFPESAKVTVTAVSEFGSEPLAGFEGLDVAGRSWVTFDLSRTIPFLDNVTFIVATEQGIVIPSLALADDFDEASWPGIGLATTWDFPATGPTALESSVALSNTGREDAIVAIDIFTVDGPLLDATTVTVPPAAPLRVVLSDLAAPPFGIRVRSDVPIAAMVQTRVPVPDEDEGEEIPPDEGEGTSGEEASDVAQVPPVRGLGGTVGIVEPAVRWLVPGVSVIPDTLSSIWVMNATAQVATVTLTPLGRVVAGTPEKVLVAPGTVFEFVAPPRGQTLASSYLVDATVPVSVGVSHVGERGVALVAAIAVE